MIEGPNISPEHDADIKFTRVTVLLLLLAALVTGAVAGGGTALLYSRAAPRAAATAPASRPAARSDSVPLRQADPVTVTVTTLGSAESLGTPSTSPPRSALGTGVVLDLDGYILTTADTVKNYQVQVLFYDGRAARAALVGLDDETGLALLKVSATVPQEPSFARVSDSDLGDSVVSLGTSLKDLKRTLGAGIIGGLGYSAVIQGTQPVDNLIRTNARAPEGYAGGPVVNSSGKIIGITLGPDKKLAGWSLVLPADTARAIARRIISNGAVPRASLGIYYVTVTTQTAKLRGLNQSGALVTAVLPGTPAAKALRPGDLIISLDGKVVDEQQTLESLLASYRPGQKVKLQIVRRNLIVNASILLASKSPAPSPTPGPTVPSQ